MIVQSEEIGELAAALAEAQGKFEPVGKNDENPHFGNKFANLAAIVEATREALAEHGLSVVQMPGFDGTNDILTTRVMHKSGQWIESTMRLLLGKNDAQGQGSAITYGRRYARSGALGIVTEEDDDGNAASQGRPRSTTRRSAPARQAPAQTPPGATNGSGGTDPATMDLRGLTAYLEANGLDLTGNTEKKRLRVAEHMAGMKPEVATAISPEQTTKVAILLSERGLTETRHQFMSDLLGRLVTSTKDLTKIEAHTLIEELESMKVPS